MQYLTAYGGLIDIGGLSQGEIVVITAASSSVGLAAIQIANMVGAIPVAVTRTADKRQALLDAGAHHVIASAEEDLEAGLRTVAGPGGFNCFRSGRRADFRTLGRRYVARRHLDRVSGTERRADAVSAFQRAEQEPDVSGLSRAWITGDPARLDAAKSFILRRIERGLAGPHHYPNLCLRSDRRCYRFLNRTSKLARSSCWFDRPLFCEGGLKTRSLDPCIRLPKSSAFREAEGTLTFCHWPSVHVHAKFRSEGGPGVGFPLLFLYPLVVWR